MSSIQSITLSAWQNNVLQLHNQERNRLGIANLSPDSSLIERSQIWADQGTNSNVYQHSYTPNVGENLAGRTDQPSRSDEYMSTLLFNQWLDERKGFVNNGLFPNGDYSNPTFPSVIGHYTQMIWRATTKLGCGLSRNGYWAYLVCRYNPPGNVIGEKVY